MEFVELTEKEFNNNIKEILGNGCSQNELCYHCGNTANCKAQRLGKCF